jgi:hypothetical protein
LEPRHPVDIGTVQGDTENGEAEKSQPAKDDDVKSDPGVDAAQAAQAILTAALDPLVLSVLVCRRWVVELGCVIPIASAAIVCGVSSAQMHRLSDGLLWFVRLTHNELR